MELIAKEGVNMTIKEAIGKATIKIKTKNVDSPKLKARLLMQYILKQTRQYLMVYDDNKLTQAYRSFGGRSDTNC